MKRLSAVLLIAAMALWLAPTHAEAAKFPNKPVRLVIPYSPGGSHDAHARAFASVMEPYLGQPMLAVIRAGGGGSIGASFVARARADGHTLILGDQQSILVKPLIESLPYSSGSFVPVGRINYSPLLITVKKDAPWKNLRDLVEDAKRRPGKISFGGVPGLGVDQIPMELLSLKAGIKLKFVPFQGGGPTWKAFLGGHIDIAPAFASTVTPQLSKGAVPCSGYYRARQAAPASRPAHNEGAGIRRTVRHVPDGLRVQKDARGHPGQAPGGLRQGGEGQILPVHGEAHGRAGDLHERKKTSNPSWWRKTKT